MSAEYILEVPLDARPRLLVGNLATHGHYKDEFYRLPQAWCLHAYRYEAGLLVDNHPLEIRPGRVGIIPADVDIAFRFRRYPSHHIYLHYQLDPGPRPGVPIPAMQDMALRFDGFFAEMEQIVASMSGNRTRGEVKLWDLLWELADRHAARTPAVAGRHPAVAKVLSTIELRLGSPLRVEELAAEVDLSHNHLTRLFRQETGMTVIGYIRKRRIERARHLLAHSTRPIKSIAFEVGIPDLQHFNKLVRRELGSSPRRCRYNADT